MLIAPFVSVSWLCSSFFVSYVIKIVCVGNAMLHYFLTDFHSFKTKILGHTS